MGSQLPAVSPGKMLKALARLDVHPPIKKRGGGTRGKGSHTFVVGPTGRRSTVMAREHAPSEVRTVLKDLAGVSGLSRP